MRNLATLAVAVFLGLIAVILVRSYLGRQVQGPSAETATIPVVVAAQPIARGVALQPAMLKTVVFPRDSLPTGSFPDVAQVTGAKEGPRVAMRAFLPNEPLLTGNVSAPGGRPNLSEALTAGMRAVSFRSGDVAGVGGFVLPGDRVDVLLTRQLTGDRNEQVTQVLAENIRVLGVDQSDDNQATKPVVTRTVTLEVSPDQAEAISLGETVGQVSLTLRQTADGTPLTRLAFTVDDLTAQIPKKKAAPAQVARAVQKTAPPPVAPAPPPPPQTVVRVVRGVDATYYAGTETSLTAVAGRAPPPAAAPIPPAAVRP